MPKENIIPIENKKPVEEVRFWDYKEVKKSPLSVAARSKVISRHNSDYLSSRVISNDIAVSQMYGPGFWDFAEDFMDGAAAATKFTGKLVGGLAVGTVVVATGGAAAVPLGAAVGTLGYMGQKAAEEGILGDNKVVKEAVDFVGDCAINGGYGVVLDGALKVAKVKSACKTCKK